jgi:hypothetical protein
MLIFHILEQNLGDRVTLLSFASRRHANPTKNRPRHLKTVPASLTQEVELAHDEPARALEPGAVGEGRRGRGTASHGPGLEEVEAPHLEVAILFALEA